MFFHSVALFFLLPFFVSSVRLYSFLWLVFHVKHQPFQACVQIYECDSLLGRLLFGITWVEQFTFLTCGQKETCSAKATHAISIEIRILNLTKAVIVI